MRYIRSQNLVNIKIIIPILIFVTFLSIANIDTKIFAVEYYSQNEEPFGKPFEYWTGEFWNWWFSVKPDEVFNQEKLSSSNCLAKTDGHVVFLMNPSFANDVIIKNCHISPQQGILFTFLTSECDKELKDMEDASYDQLTRCAIEDNTAPVFEKQGFVNSKKIGENYIQKVISNEFKLKIGKDSVYHPDAIEGIWDAVAHGYYVFLKPLPIGTHTIQFKTFISGVPWGFSSDITYNLLVK